MTQDERNDTIGVMAATLDAQDSPKVGFFWYDAKERELFGVVKSLASDIPFTNKKKTVGILHKDHWNKEFKKNLRSGKPSRFTGDYTDIPRGRVFEVKDKGFEVMVGCWLGEHPEAEELIIDEFDLHGCHVEFIQDEHWDIGRGWSEEFF